jgi:hypothetical protein
MCRYIFFIAGFVDHPQPGVETPPLPSSLRPFGTRLPT